MAIDMKQRGTIGCAYYVAREEKLCMMEDIQMGRLDIVDTLKVHVQPTVVLISSRAEESLEEHLKRDAKGIDRGEDASMCVCPHDGAELTSGARRYLWLVHTHISYHFGVLL